jgi:hypothetical protein
VTHHRGFAIAVGTLVWAVSSWFGFLAFSTASATAVTIMGVGLAFAIYAVAGFSGAPDVAATGFRSALIAFGVAAVAVVAYMVTNVDGFAVAAPVIAVGVGCGLALQPATDQVNVVVRFVVTVLVAIIAVWVYNVDPTVYGLVSPLMPLPALVVADTYYARVRAATSETVPD